MYIDNRVLLESDCCLITNNCILIIHCCMFTIESYSRFERILTVIGKNYLIITFWQLVIELKNVM